MKEYILEQLNWRYATKVFDKNKKLSDSDFNFLLEALRLSPSSYGLQAWKFISINNPVVREELKAHSYNQSQITDASHLIVLCSFKDVTPETISKYIHSIADIRGVETSKLDNFKKTILNFTVEKSEEEVSVWISKQVYIALGTLLTACALLKIDSCPIEGFDEEKYDEILKLDQYGITSRVVCPVGYRNENDNSAKLKKVRYDLKEVVIEID